MISHILSKNDVRNIKSDVKGFMLKKKSNQPFKILQLTDIQLIDPNQEPYPGRLPAIDFTKHWDDTSYCVFNLVRRLIKETSPDYIVITGDNVYGQFDASGERFKEFISTMDSFEIPWSFVNGNHDGEYVIQDPVGNKVKCGRGMEWQADYVKENGKYCLYEAGKPVMGVGNYIVHLLNENNKEIFNFIFMDSHACIGYQDGGITDEQVEWYEEVINKANSIANRIVPNFCFMHIGIEQFNQAVQMLGGEGSLIEITTDGSIDKNGNFGANYEKACLIKAPKYWQKIKELGSTKGLFVGHDHINNSSIMFEGVRLTYGTKTGTYDYHNVNQQGGTLISINDDSTFDVKPILMK